MHQSTLEKQMYLYERLCVAEEACSALVAYLDALCNGEPSEPSWNVMLKAINQWIVLEPPQRMVRN